MMKVSVIMPLYNAEMYMDQSIESILSQSYTNLEILLVDDGSTDHTLKKARAYAEQDSRVIVLTQNNSGPGEARNNGLSHATGEFVCFIDSDDYMLVNAIEIMINAISDSDLVQCRSEKVYSDDKPDEESWPDKIINLNNTVAMEDYLYSSKPVVRFSVWAKLYRKSVLEDVRFPNIKNSEDVVFNAFAIQNSKHIKYIPDILYRVLIRDGSLSHGKITMDKVRSAYRCSEMIMELVSEDKRYQQYLGRVYWTMQLTQMRNACMLFKHNKNEFVANRDAFRQMGRQYAMVPSLDLTKRLMIIFYRLNPSLFARLMGRILV